MFLHETPFDKLRIGGKVESERGRPGVIIELSSEGRHPSYVIEWSSEPPWEKEEQKQSSQYFYPTDPHTARLTKGTRYLG